MGAKYTVNAQAGVLELALDGVIGDDWAEDPITAAGVRKALAAAPGVGEIRVAINSPGGSFFEGLQIYQLLQSHPATVTVLHGALVASSASLIAMAGDKRIAHETSQLLVHNPWTIVAGNENELRKVADDLHTLSGSLVLAYASRTGMAEDAIRSLMDEDRYMSAAEALKLGLLTEVTSVGKPADPVPAEQARAQLNNLRAQARQRLAAMAAVTDQPKAPSAAKEIPTVNLALIVAALGLPDSATEVEVADAIKAHKSVRDDHQKVLDAVGAKTSEEAIGIVAALKGADERATAAEKQLSELRASAEKSERDQIVATLRAEKRVTPAQEKDLLPALSIEALKAFAKTAPKVSAMASDGLREPGAAATGHKAFKDMSAAEQRELAISDPELYEALKSKDA